MAGHYDIEMITWLQAMDQLPLSTNPEIYFHSIKPKTAQSRALWGAKSIFRTETKDVRPFSHLIFEVDKTFKGMFSHNSNWIN